MPICHKTPEVMAQIKAAIECGQTVETACGIAGIGQRTYYRWMREDEDFNAEISQAIAKRDAATVTRLKANGKGDWKADAWLLERTSPLFRPKQDVNVQVQKGLTDVLEAIRPLVSDGAFKEMIGAIATLQGHGAQDPG